MSNNLQEDLCEILITGADKSEVRSHLLSKGYNSDDIEKELSQIAFAYEKNSLPDESKSSAKTKPTKKIITAVILVLTIGIILKLLIFNQFRKKTYALINVQICNATPTQVIVETNLANQLSSPYVSSGCLGVTFGQELPTDYLYSEQFYIKISVDGKSQTFYNVNIGSLNNIFTRAQINSSSGKEGFFSNQEIQYVTYTITAADVAECK